MNKLFTDYGEILEVDNVKMYALIDNKFYSSDNITYKNNEYIDYLPFRFEPLMASSLC